MNRLDNLIQDLCPDGVPFYELCQIAEYCKARICANEVNEGNYVGVDNLLPDKLGKKDSDYVPTEGQIIAFNEGDILIGNIRPYLKKIWRATISGGTNGDVLVIHITDGRMMPEFLYYLLSSDDFFAYDNQHAKGAKMPRGDKDAIMRYHVPLPPIEVQREIVRILDNFTELTERLTAELMARKKQYEYYRDMILNFDHFGGGG